jgi:hypothetical protein
VNIEAVMHPTPFRFNHTHASFDEFVERDRDGRACFEGQRPTESKRHRERVWPALSRYKRIRLRRCPRFHPWPASRIVVQPKRLKRASWLTVRRGWYPCHPLVVRHMRVCDLAQRPPLPTD